MSTISKVNMTIPDKSAKRMIFQVKKFRARLRRAGVFFL